MMTDLKYRERLQSLSAASESACPPDSHYRECARQYGSRWGSWLPPDRRAVFLDLACGYGEWLYFLRQRGYTNIIGIDVSAAKIECAHSAGLDSVSQHEAREFMRRAGDRFDVVTAFNFFEHLAKDEVLDLLQLIHGTLRPGGRLLVVTPNGLSPFSGATRYWDFSHEQSFTPASWRQISAFVGFNEVHFEEYGPIAHSMTGTIRVGLWHGIRLLIKFVNYVEVGGPRGEAPVYTADMKVILVKR